MHCFVWFNPCWADAFPSRLMERYQKHTSGKNVLLPESRSKKEEGPEVDATVTFKFFISVMCGWGEGGACARMHATVHGGQRTVDENYSSSTVRAQKIFTPGGKRFLQFSCHAGLRSPLN